MAHDSLRGIPDETIGDTNKELSIDDRRNLYKRLDGIGLKLAMSRSEAIFGRQNLGIEEEWLQDEEYYEGIDEANRLESTAWRSKPLGSPLPIDENKDSRGSTIFLNITRAYVDATAARMDDLILSPGEKTFKVKPTPRPELLALSKGKIPLNIKKSLAKGQNPQLQQDQAINEAKELVNRANETSKRIEEQIWDWNVESQYAAHNRRVIEDSAKVGSGILKGPIPIKTVKMIYQDGQIQMVSEIKPASIRINYRNFFPDPACGENLHNGTFTWERDDITNKALGNLKDTPGYITEQINRCIQEGPMQATKEFKTGTRNPGLRLDQEAQKTLFEIWYYYGSMKKIDLLTFDIIAEKYDINDTNKIDEEAYVFVQVTMVNNRVIKANLSHLQTGDFPYDMMVWQRRIGMPWGLGVARQIRPAQRIIVGAMRHMMDNAGIAGGPMLFVDTNMIQPADGIAEIKPWKMWIAADNAEPGQTNVKLAIVPIIIPMMQVELQAIIELGLKMAEDVTGLPLIMQGQTNQRTPNTLGGMQIQNNNASTVLRRVVRLYDDMLTEPHIRRYYDHMLQYSEDDTLKGEFKIHALGSSALIERDMANNALTQMAEYVQDPIFKKDPQKWIDELLKANKFDPSRINYDDDDWQKIVENLRKPKEDPKLQIEQMKIQHQEQMAKFQADFDAKMTETNNMIKVQGDERDREFELRKLNIEDEQKNQELIIQKREQEINLVIEQTKLELDVFIAEMKEKGLNERELEKIKQKITDTTMKLQTQISLSGTEVLKPPVEPKGRAADGKSFTK